MQVVKTRKRDNPESLVASLDQSFDNARVDGRRITVTRSSSSASIVDREWEKAALAAISKCVNDNLPSNKIIGTEIITTSGRMKLVATLREHSKYVEMAEAEYVAESLTDRLEANFHQKFKSAITNVSVLEEEDSRSFKVTFMCDSEWLKENRKEIQNIIIKIAREVLNDEGSKLTSTSGIKSKADGIGFIIINYAQYAKE